MAISLEEVNFLVWRYLTENGFEHSAFLFESESALDPTAGRRSHTPPGALVAYLQKSLHCLSVEKCLAAVRDSPDSPAARRLASLELRFAPPIPAPTVAPPPTLQRERVQLSAEVATVLASHRSSVYCGRWSPSGRQFATASSDASVIIWTMAGATPTGHVVLALPAGPPGDRDFTCIDWAPSGQALAAGSLDNQVRLYSAAGHGIATLVGHKDHVFAVRFSPTGDLIVSAGADHSAIVWRTDGQLLQQFGFHTDTVLAVAWRNAQVFATASADGDVGICTVGRGFQVLKGHTGIVNAVAYNSTGGTLASASDDATVRLWAAARCDVLGPHDSQVTQVEWLPGSDAVVVSGSMNGLIRVWDTSRAECVRCVDHKQQGLISMSLAPIGGLVATGSQDHKIVVSKLGDGGMVASFSGNSDVYDVAWDLGGKFLAACFDDSTVAIIPMGSYLR
jgi:WD40 repeat protein